MIFQNVLPTLEYQEHNVPASCNNVTMAARQWKMESGIYSIKISPIDGNICLAMPYPASSEASVKHIFGMLRHNLL